MKYNGVKIVAKMDGARVVPLETPVFAQSPLVDDVYEWEGRFEMLTVNGRRDVTDEYVAAVDPEWMELIAIEETQEAMRRGM